MDSPQPSKSSLFGNIDLALTFGLFGIIVLLVLPVPTGMLDLLLALSIGLSLLLLLIVVYLKDPSDFSVFPVILLGVTLFRLGLNVASTRLILLDGFAGDVIQSFGDFVVQGNYVVGAVVFLILVVINFVVITKGAGRIAEVAARFTLDSLPGKQMSIDAELNAGIIDESVATKRRAKLQKEADFYGAMDGASKFVRGDAIAGILITLINVLGGISIGIFEKALPLGEALQRYTLLSIGDGLVSQIPALIISIGAGILITRTADGYDLSRQLGKQIRVYPRAVGIASIMLFTFGILPGMPFFPFFILSLGCGVLGLILKKNQQNWAVEEEALDAADSKKALPGGASAGGSNDPAALPGPTQEGKVEIKDMVQSDVFAVELGISLVSLADTNQGGDLLDRVTSIREKFARELGMIIPSISVTDNLQLGQEEYRFLIRDKEVARGQISPGRMLAVNVGNSPVGLRGLKTVEPVFQMDAYWINDSERNDAEINGYATVDAPSVLITHLTEVIKDNAHRLLEREDVQKLLDIIKEKNPTLVEELIPDKISVGLVQRVLKNLLREKVGIKNLTLILEAIGDCIEFTKSPDDLSEHVRKQLGMYFVPEFEDDDGTLKVLTIDPALEHLLLSRVKKSQNQESGLMMDPEATRKILEDMKPKIEQIVNDGLEPVILTIAELRLPFKSFFDPSFPRLSVLSYQELPKDISVQSVGVIAIPEDVLERALANQQPLPQTG